jgi:hypothetical protein
MRAGRSYWLYRSPLWVAVLAGIIFWAALGPVNRDGVSRAAALEGAPTAQPPLRQILDPGGVGGVGG